MQEREETILFSAIAVLLAAMTLWTLVGLVYPDAKAATNPREIQFARYATCAVSAEAPSMRSGADG